MTPDCVLRARRDVVWQAEEEGWLAFDPLARQSYRCGRAEHWLFQQFDGRTSLADISRQSSPGAGRARYELTWTELHSIASSLLARGLVRTADSAISLTSPGSQTNWLQWFSQSVSWRMRGVDPSWYLARLAPHVNCFFSSLAVRGWLVAAMVVSLIVLADFERLCQQATLWQWLIKPTSGSMLFAIFVITRGIHELGHALVLTRYGGRCPDIGLIFMLGAPCVYCDVTESWRLRNWQQRAAVAAGGMYAELIVATCAGIVWLCTIPGLVNTLALQTMIVCSVSTWLVNANPLMRFDGYFILSDWLGEANLRARADECCLQVFDRLVLGVRSARPVQVSLARRRFYCAFSIGGLVYRLGLSWMMAAVIAALYAAWHFAWLGRMMAVLLLACWWGIPAMKFVKHLWHTAQSVWSRVRLGVLAAWLVLIICAIPLPYRIYGRGWVQPKRLQGIYAPATTRLGRVHKSVGSHVQAGELVAQLDRTQPQLRSIELKLNADRAQAQLTNLRRQHRLGDELSVDLRALETTSRTSARQAEHAQAIADQYDLQTAIPGQLISFHAPALTDVDHHPVTTQSQLWLDPHQQGRLVPAGTLLAAVCGQEQIAIVPLADEQLADVNVGTRVRLLFPSEDDRMIHAEVAEIVQLNQIDSINRLLEKAVPQSETTASTTETDSSRAAYAAVVHLPPGNHQINASAQAVFDAPARTLATRLNAWAHQNLRWLVDSF